MIVGGPEMAITDHNKSPSLIQNLHKLVCIYSVRPNQSYTYFLVKFHNCFAAGKVEKQLIQIWHNGKLINLNCPKKCKDR